MRLQPKKCPVMEPKPIIQKMIVHAAINGVLPILNIFLKLNSKPNVNIRKMTPMSAHVEMFVLSTMDGKNANWGPQRKPATIYPNTSGCLSLRNMIVTIPAMTRMSAKSLINVGIDPIDDVSVSDQCLYSLYCATILQISTMVLIAFSMDGMGRNS